MPSAQVVGGLTLVLAGLVAVLVVVVLLLALRLRRLAADQRRAFDGVEVDVLGVLARQARRLDGVDASLAALGTRADDLRTDLGQALTRLGVVRYDAFDDTGGEQSFSAAVLDAAADGFVLTAINGRTDGRTFLKVITGGEATVMLSAEERLAVEAARSGRREERVTERGVRRWRRPK